MAAATSPKIDSAREVGFVGQGFAEWGRKFRRAKIRRAIAANEHQQQAELGAIGELAWAANLAPAGAEDLRSRLREIETAQSGVASEQASLDEDKARLEQEKAAAVERFDERRNALRADRRDAKQHVAAATEDDKEPLEAALAAADAALAQLARERKKALAPLDQRLSETRKAASGAAKEGAALEREKKQLFAQLGGAVVATGTENRAIAAALAELEDTRTTNAGLQAELSELQAASAAVPARVMAKFYGLGALVVLIALLLGSVIWWARGESTSLPGGTRSRESSAAVRRQRPRDTRPEPAERTGLSAEQLDDLVATLGSDDPDARVEAGQELGAAGAVTALVGPLREGDDATRADAAYALAEMGALSAAEAGEAIPALLAALEDDHWRVRANAALALGKSGPGYDEIWEPLAATVGDTDARVRGTAAYALGRSGVRPAASVEILAPLVLEDEIPDVRVLAVNGLTLSGEPAAVPALVAGLIDDNWEVQYASIRGLGLLEDAAVEALPALIDRLPVLEPWNAAMVATSIRMIVEATGPQYRPPADLAAALQQRVGTIVRALPHNSPSDGVPIARVLPTLVRWMPGATTQLTVDLTPMLWGTGEGTTRAMAEDVLPTLLLVAGVDRANIATLAERLDDGDRNVRWATVAALGAAGNERAVAPLIDALADEDPTVQYVAALGLAHLDPAARAPLSAALRHTDAGVRMHAAYAIAVMGRSRGGDDQAMVTALTAALQDDAFVVREAVACALKTIQRIARCDPEELTFIAGS